MMPALIKPLIVAFILTSSINLAPAHASQPRVPFVAPTALTSQALAGQSMRWVKAHYGTPQHIRQSADPVKAQWPRITVWDYGIFAVYFEQKIVLHTVVRTPAPDPTHD